MLLAREHRAQLLLVQSWRETWDTAYDKTVVFKMHLQFQAFSSHFNNVFGPIRWATPEKHNEAIFGTSTNHIFLDKITAALEQ